MSNFTYPWKVQGGDSERHYQLAIPTGAQKLVISFEYSAPDLPGQITSIMGLRCPALPKRHQLLVGYQVNKPNLRRNIDDGKGGLHGGRLRAWYGGNMYQAELSVDLQKGGFTFVEALDQIAGSISTLLGAHPTVLDLSFGQAGIADGAYYPPLGFTFYEVSVTLDGVPIVAEPGPDAGTIPPPPPVVVAPPPAPPVVVAPPPPPPSPPPPAPAPQPAPAPAPQGGPDVAGIEVAIASIYGAHGNLGIGVILGLLGRYLPSPWNALVPLLVTELTKGGA